MAVPVFLAGALAWLVRSVFIKALALTAVFAVVAVAVPLAVGFLAPHIGLGGLNSAFAGISPGVWFWLDFFNLGFGLPLLISAFVARFLIRRLPVIG